MGLISLELEVGGMKNRLGSLRHAGENIEELFMPCFELDLEMISSVLKMISSSVRFFWALWGFRSSLVDSVWSLVDSESSLCEL